jgi:cytoskeletal protein RodZ
MVKHKEKRKKDKSVDSYIMILACVLLGLIMFLVILTHSR